MYVIFIVNIIHISVVFVDISVYISRKKDANISVRVEWGIFQKSIETMSNFKAIKKILKACLKAQTVISRHFI